jgi:hypothetical protein
MGDPLRDDVHHYAGRALRFFPFLERRPFHRHTVSAGIERQQVGHLNGATARLLNEANRSQNAFEAVELLDRVKLLLGLGIVFIAAFQDERNAFAVCDPTATLVRIQSMMRLKQKE